MLKIEKVFNNNVVQASDENDKELIVMGRAWAFKKNQEIF